LSEARLRVHLPTAAAVVFLISALPSTGQQAPDQETVLQQTRERLLEDLARLPHYTCVQSITRKYFAAPSRKRESQCTDLIAAHDARTHEMTLEAWDRLRLDVAIAERGNVFSWVGAPRFEEGALEKLAGHGPLGSGDFGVFLGEIFQRGIVSSRGDEPDEPQEGRRLLKFSYEVPIGRSKYQIHMNTGWVLTGYSGTFRLDAGKTDLDRLAVRTAELPPGGPICQATSEVEYGRTLIHDRMILIPRETRLRTINSDGGETLSVTTYSSCREYASKSRMLLEAPPSSAVTGVKAPPVPLGSLPEGLHFETRITTPIDSDTASAGDPIEAVLRSPMRDKEHAVVAPAGSRLHGRLVRIQYQANPAEHFQIGVQLESIEIAGRSIPLKAARYAITHPGAIIYYDMARTSRAEGNAGVGIFVFLGPRLRLKQFDSEWITLSSDSKSDPSATDTH
jgi:hypothetical protein